MKNLLLFILLLLSKTLVFACGFTPYGEELRFRLVNPFAFANYSGYQTFFYNANTFGDVSVEKMDYDQNVKDWYSFLDKKVPMLAIDDFLYHQSFTDIHASSSNLFIQYLYTTKQNEVLEYLKWAKTCEYFTSEQSDDSWERSADKNKITRANYLKELQQKIQQVQSAYLQRRYAFLITRLAYYNFDFKVVEKMYERYFTNSKKDFLYYWALYFYCFTDKVTSLDLANVMTYSPEKRHAIYYHLRTKFSLKDALKEAKTNAERANAHSFLQMQNLDYNLEGLKKIYQLNPTNEQLDFLLLREISKLEDWIYTPYYTFNSPSVGREESEVGAYESYAKTHYRLIKKSEEKNRIYAKQLLAFVNQCDFSKVKDKMLWEAMKIQLQFMAKEFHMCIQSAVKFEKKHTNSEVLKEIQQIRLLALIANQKYGKAIIPTAIHQELEANWENSYFMFAFARELEYLGNYPDAMAILTHINREDRNYYDESSSMHYWLAQKPKGKGQIAWFGDYFSYVDYMYSAEQIETILTAIKQPKSSVFEQKKYKNLVHDQHYLEDLLGMKYIRLNKLKEALTVYKQMNQSYWKNNYSAWERDVYDYESFTFDKNPFYQIRYTPDFIPPKKHIEMTKPAILEQLIQFVDRAEDTSNPNRAMDCFYAATCFFNMSQYGHAWMMRRFSSSWYFSNSDDNMYYEDEKEYRTNEKAQKYYHLAYQTAKTKKMKALCLRMENYVKYVGTGKYNYTEMRKKYPEYYSDLSTCENLNVYFQ